jgi:hypothetical protein
MIRHTRPELPVGFPPKKVQTAAQRLRGQRSAAKASAHWSDWKPDFYRAQHHRCAWCDVQQTGDVGAVDHVAPKGAVARLGKPGVEVDDSTHFIDREFQPVHGVGYWWLTYAWENWVYSCNRCNSYKSALYPVEEDPHPAPEEGATLTPLLLHPFGPEDPEDHLDVDPNGQIHPRSPRGHATIHTCGLDRESLRYVRAQVVERVQALCEQLLETGEESVAENLGRELRDDANLASVARAVVRRELGVAWRELMRSGSPGEPTSEAP